MNASPHTKPTLRAPLFRGLAVMAGLAFCAVAHAQPTLSSIYPDGQYQFQPSATLSFVANASAGVTNTLVQLTGTALGSSQALLKNLTPGHGLTVSGPATSETVSCVLTSNTLYSATIKVWDANGQTATSTISFDTIIPAYTWEAEDWDYATTNSDGSISATGLFFDNPQTNAYAHRVSAIGSDFNHDTSSGNSDYRPRGLATEGNGDKKRIPWGGQSDYDVGWNNGGDWANYTRTYPTRTYPAGTYYIYMRGACGGGQSPNSASIMVVNGTASLSSSGVFSVPNLGGWQAYSWVALKDGSGNPVTLTTDGTASTLQIQTVGGSYNANFYMLIPPQTNLVSGTAVITNMYPDGAVQFEATNVFTFEMLSPVGIDASSITVQAGITNVAGQGSVQVYSVGSGVTVTGSATDMIATIPLATNNTYSLFIQVSDLNGNPSSTSARFDTVQPAYTWEAEDWNYGGGLFVDNPQTNAYYGIDSSDPSVAEIDFHRAGGGGGNSYGHAGLATEPASDAARVTHEGLQDFDIGNASGGNWCNYTRTFPDGVFNIYVRVSNGNGNSTTDAGSIWQVTNPTVDTSSGQTAVKLGTFNAPATGGWQTYTWVPVLNPNGDLARFSGGSVETLRYTVDNGGHNPNFFMLLPADLSHTPPPYVTGFQPDGTGLFQFTNKLSFVANSYVGLAANNITVKVDGVLVNNLSFTGPATAWSVSCPVTTNAFHTVVVTLQDAAGTASYTNRFNTFDPADYQFEAVDYDYTENGTSGQFFDDSSGQDLYAGRQAAPGIDAVESDANAFGRGYNYRAGSSSTTYDFPDSSANDVPRDQFANSGATDYSVGSFGPNSWANYTRTYPAGTYNVFGRFAEGAAASEAVLSQLVSGYGTSTQVVSPLGTFQVPAAGWSSWEWAPLMDANANLVKVTLTGAQTTLQLGGSPNGADPEVNVHFFVLVPSKPWPNPTQLACHRTGSNVTVSFPTQSGYTYQVYYKDRLTDAAWLPLANGSVTGTGSTQSITDAMASSRFYRLQIQ